MFKQTVSWLAAFGFLVSLPAMAAQVKAKEMTFEGNIVSVDTAARAFVVRNEVKGKAAEMKFHVGQESHLMIDGQRMLLSQLEKGEHVTVTYEEGAQPLAKNVHRHKSATRTR